MLQVHGRIEYQHGQTRGAIDGQLRDDDTVELTLRSAPTTAPG